MGFLDSVRVALRDAVSPRAQKQPRTVPAAVEEDAPGVSPVEVAPEVFDTHTVEVGDTLQEICARAGTSVEEVVRINDIEDPDLIFPGQVFRLPMR